MKPISFLCGLLLTIIFINANAQCVQSTSAGYSHSVAIKPDGTLWAWGFNASGQLGDGTTEEKDLPIQIGTAQWKMVSAGGSHTMAIKPDGTLWAWGENLYGIGDGTFANVHPSPIKIGTDTNWKAVYAGSGYSIALKTDGTLWSWGDNFYGMLGRGGSIFVPGKIGTDTNWKSVATGNNHVLAIKTDGTLWAWGHNGNYELGDGTTTDRSAPVKIGSATNWASIAAGDAFSVALKTDGTLWTWGDNFSGQLGNGSNSDVFSPMQIGTSTDWKAIGAGLSTLQAIKTDGTLWQSGYVFGTFETTTNVLTKLGTASNWSSIATGGGHTLAFATDGTLWAWGDGTWGTLGIGAWGDYTTPIVISPNAPQAQSIQSSCKSAPTIADLLPTGPTLKWYSASSGGTALALQTPIVNGVKYYVGETKFGCESSTRTEVLVNLTEPTPVPGGITNQSLCTETTIGDIVVTGTDIKWYGAKTGGSQLYEGSLLVNGQHYFASQTINSCESDRKEFIVTIGTPLPPSGPASQTFCAGAKLSSLQASGEDIKWYYSKQPVPFEQPYTFNALLTNGGHVYATQTVDGCESAQRLDVTVTLTPNNTQAPVAYDPLIADKLYSDGASLSAVIDTQGRLWAWGWNGEKQLQDGTFTSRNSPMLIDNGPWRSVGGGGVAMFGIKTDGSLWAWGLNNYGQLGIDGVNNVYPITRVGTENNWKKIAFSYYTAGAVKNDGTLWTWGMAEGHYLIGTGVYNNVFVPTQVGSQTNWSDISDGFSFFHAIKTDGSLYAWGTNAYGELGDGTNTDRYLPTTTNTSAWKIVKGNANYSIGIKTDGTLWSWGNNERGVLGIDEIDRVTTPSQVGVANDWKDVALGYAHVLGLKNDGSIWAWGTNTNYQLGNGTTVKSAVPVRIGNENNWKSIAAGSDYSIAIKTDGSIWSWGGNSTGQLDQGTDDPIQTPKRLYAGVQQVCESATLGDLTTMGTDVQWYAESWYAHTGVFDPLPSTTVVADKKHYFGTQTVDGCESPTRLTLLVELKETSDTAAPTGSATQTFCAGTTVARLKATGNKIKWFENSSGGSPLSSETVLLDNHNYYASQSINGCESTTRLAVNVTLENSSIPAPTGNQTQTFCNGATLQDIVATGSSVKWYAASSGGSPLLPSVVLVNGNHYYASQTTDDCESIQRLDVKININVANAPTGTATQSFCFQAKISDLTATGSGIKWYSAPTGGSALAANTQLVNGSQYFASQTTGDCESVTRLAVLVSLNLTPAPTGNATQTFCEGATVANLVVTGSTIQWYAASTGGNVLASSTLLVNGSHYYASQTVGACQSATRRDVVAVINPTPVAPIEDITKEYETGKKLSDVVISGTSIKWYASASDALNHRNVLPASSLLQMGASYFATQTVLGCESPATEVTPSLITGLESEVFGLTVYPNPVKKTLNISMDERIDNITLSDLKDHRLIYKDVGDTATTLDLGGFASGVYLVQLKVKERTIVVKVVKE